MNTVGEHLAARWVLVKDRAAVRNCSKALTLTLLKHQSQQHLNQIQSQIQAINRELEAILAANARLKTRSDILMRLPSFTANTAAALLINMPELGSMNSKPTGSLAGLALVTRQSGQI